MASSPWSTKLMPGNAISKVSPRRLNISCVTYLSNGRSCNQDRSTLWTTSRAF